MRIEYVFGLERVEAPRFSVESSEGAHKLFTLATVVLNVLHERPRADVVFHSPNAQDLPKTIGRFKTILESAPDAELTNYVEGKSGEIGGTYYRWLSIRARDGGAGG